MTEGKHRIVVWSTGGIGSIAIRAIGRRADLDLVGVWVHSPEKDGRDARCRISLPRSRVCSVRSICR